MTIHRPTPEQERQSRADRYVLGDPGLDRQAFEAEMLDDEELAWLVAQSVGELGMIAVASQSAGLALRDQLAAWPAASLTNPKNPKNPTSRQRRVGYRSRYVIGPLCGLAAAVCLAVLSDFRWPTSSRPAGPETPSTQATFEAPIEMSQLAETWLALEIPLEDEPLVSLPDEVVEIEAVVIAPATPSPVEEDDWMVEAAQMYFQEFDS